MRLTELTDSEILLKLETLSQRHNVKLRFAHKLFYISLLHLCEKEGNYDNESEQYYVALSINDFAKTFSVSPTTVVQALKLLKECNVIHRDTYKRDFSKLHDNGYVTNGAGRTYVNTIDLHEIMKGE